MMPGGVGLETKVVYLSIWRFGGYTTSKLMLRDKSATTALKGGIVVAERQTSPNLTG